jgi:hypothetical protein
LDGGLRRIAGPDEPDRRSRKSEDLAQPGDETFQRAAAEEVAGVPGVGPFLTRDEFEAYASGMTQTMVAPEQLWTERSRSEALRL